MRISSRLSSEAKGIRVNGGESSSGEGSEVKALEKQIETVKKEIDRVDKSTTKSEAEKEKQKKELKEQLAQLEEQLAKARAEQQKSKRVKKSGLSGAVKSNDRNYCSEDKPENILNSSEDEKKRYRRGVGVRVDIDV